MLVVFPMSPDQQAGVYAKGCNLSESGGVTAEHLLDRVLPGGAIHAVTL